MPYKKLSNESKNWLVNLKKTKDNNNLILLLNNINANIKKIGKHSQTCMKFNAYNVYAIKPY